MSPSAPQSDLLSIRRFFAGRNVLVTGATGFLAKAVLEKLLRAIPDLGQVYLLIRPRCEPNGTRVEPQERLRTEILRNGAFKRLRNQLGAEFDQYCQSKIVCVAGDLTEERLGLAEGAFEELAGKIDVIINSAATVVFDERLDLALSLNALGPSRLLELARRSGSVYVHVSTAYVSGMRTGQVPERLLKPLEAIGAQLPPGAPLPLHFEVAEEVAYLQRRVEETKAACQAQWAARRLAPESEEAKKQLTAALIRAGMERAQQFGWNDTYTFTKFLGEQLLHDHRGAVPLAIVRPSIIESTLEEPEPGWLDGLRMADPIIIGFGKGRLPDFPAKLQIVLDIIPADFVVNAVLAAAAHIGRQRSGFDLFTVASSSQNPLYFGNLYACVREFFQRFPFTDKAGEVIPVPTWKFPGLRAYRRRLRRRYLWPARLANGVVNGPVPLPGTRRWRTRLRTQISKLEQLLYYAEIYGPYLHLDCRFDTAHTTELLQSLEPDERAAFNFDPTRIRWPQYLQDIHIPGLKRNILRLDSGPAPTAAVPRRVNGAAATDPSVSPWLAADLRQPPKTIVELCRRSAERFGQNPFLEIQRAPPAGESTTVRLSFAELYERSGQWARCLAAKLGLQAGDRIALVSENCPEWALAYLAIVRAGGTAVPLDRLLPPAELARLIRFVEAKALIASPSTWATLAGEAGASAGLPPALNLLGSLEPHPGQAWPQPMADPESRQTFEPSPQSLASILFTSGTTLEPKGVMLSHANFLSDALAVAQVLTPQANDRFLSVLPLHHALEFTCGLLIPLHGGARIHYLEKLRGQTVIETMQRAQITIVLGVPRLFKLFMDNVRTRIEGAGIATRLSVLLADRLARVLTIAGLPGARRRLFAKVHAAFGGHVRLFVSGGAPLDPEIFHFFQRFGLAIYEGYGLTETAPVLAVNPLGGPRPGSVGRPLPGVELRIDLLNGDGVGEILARGPNVMQGYWQNPRATAAAMVGGWFKTGDLGSVDADGYVHLTGRLNDMILTAAGKNVYPDEIEHHFRAVPGVKELCVLGLPSRTGLGEEVTAVVVPVHSSQAQEIGDAIGRLNRTLPSHQRVARIEFQAEELPKTSTLKVQRHKLRESYTGAAQTRKAGPTQPAAAQESAAETATALAEKLEPEIARLIAKASGQCNAAELTPRSQLQMDLGIDSIGLLDLVHNLESGLGIRLPDGVESRWFTVRDVQLEVQAAARAGAPAKPSFWRFRSRAHAPTARRSGFNLWQWPVLRRGLQGAFNTAVLFLLHTYWRVTFQGRQHVPANGSFILASNHCSHLDSVVLRALLGKRGNKLCFMAAKDYFFGTALKRWFVTTFLNAVPFDRKANPAESLATCKATLERGHPIVLFPEGTRSVTGELQQFKPGIGVLALELDVPLIPVFLEGTYESWPKGRRLPKPGPITVRIGPAVNLQALKNGRGANSSLDLYRQAASTIRTQIEALADASPDRS